MMIATATACLEPQELGASALVAEARPWQMVSAGAHIILPGAIAYAHEIDEILYIT
jgi:hypothetical protein